MWAGHGFCCTLLPVQRSPVRGSAAEGPAICATNVERGRSGRHQEAAVFDRRSARRYAGVPGWPRAGSHGSRRPRTLHREALRPNMASNTDIYLEAVEGLPARPLARRRVRVASYGVRPAAAPCGSSSSSMSQGLRPHQPSGVWIVWRGVIRTRPVVARRPNHISGQRGSGLPARRNDKGGGSGELVTDDCRRSTPASGHWTPSRTSHPVGRRDPRCGW